MVYDLHIHSDISDGKLSRDQIINRAKKKKIEYIAFTEHNKYKQITDSNLNIIPGIEFDACLERSFHTLCYFNNYSKSIDQLISKYNYFANYYSELLLDRIKYIHGINVNLETIQDFFDKKVVTKRDVIDWLIANNYARTVNEAANLYTNKKSKSYVRKYSLSFKEISEVINKENGVIALAHPSTLNYNCQQLELFIQNLIDYGMNGIEIINSSKTTPDEYKLYNYLAEKYDLITCGGSDFHSEDNQTLGVTYGNINKLLTKIK